ncbi:L-ascorbate oxidase [Plasmodiophora brassicae]|uniref:L-ascorbate oxidase n=1 Tax=Plasmodiophora brassicae TaxID=37360 RepID=A0A3P3YIS1_PLABS|nr:unnamed protein product [Plasmodiophora brassicae]
MSPTVLLLICCIASSAGRLVVVDLSVDVGSVAPDGVPVDALLVNGQFPGPEIHANAGDRLEITVRNQQLNGSISIHLHGIAQHGTPFYDGAAGVNQAPIPPLSQYTLRVQLGERESGTFFYHAHSGLDQSVVGALIVHNDERDHAVMNYDDERVILLSDWWHASMESLIDGLMGTPFKWIGDAQSILTNGRSPPSSCSDSTVANAALCPMDAFTAVTVDPDRTYRLRIINAGGLGYFTFSIVGHPMTIVEVEGTITEPVVVDHLEINSGQRYSVLITTNQTSASNFWMKTGVRYRPSGPTNGYALLRYSSKSTNVPPASELPVLPKEKVGWVLDQLHPKFDEDRCPTGDPDTTLVLVGRQKSLSRGRVIWAINDIALEMEDIPGGSMLKHAYDGTLDTLPENQRPLAAVPVGSVVDVVLVNTAALNGICEEHPWHLHSTSFWVLARGNGSFDPEAAARVQRHSPIRRDTETLYPFSGAYFQHQLSPGQHCGWTLLRFVADNAGVWPFHCHVISHMIMGMAVAINVVPSNGYGTLDPLPSDFP